MKHLLLGITFAAMSQGLAAAPQDQFDGDNNLLCTVQRLAECEMHSGCQPVPAEDADDIRHLNLDMDAMTVRLDHWNPGLTSKVSNVELVDDNLIIQGSDSGSASDVDGAGWTLSVNRSYGTMVMAVAGRDVAFVGMGSCITDD